MGARGLSWRWAYLALGTAWGCSFLFIKVALDFLTPFGVAFVRCALGALTLVLIARSRGVALPRERRVWGHLLVVAMCLNIVPGVLFAVAESRTTSVLAGLINGVTPLTALFFIAVVFRDDPVTRPQLVGLALGIAGVATVLGVWRGLGHNPWWAIVALLGAVTLYGASYPYSRRHLTPLGLEPVSLAAAQVMVATAVLLPFFVADGLNGHAVTLRGGAGVLALGVFGSGLAYMWNFRIIREVGSSIASTVTYLTPVVAVIVGVALLHEPLAWNEPVGGAMVLFGAAVGQGRIAGRSGYTLRRLREAESK